MKYIDNIKVGNMDYVTIKLCRDRTITNITKFIEFF